MTKKIFWLFATVLCVLTTSEAYAQKYENGLIDKTVAVVGGEMILLSQVEQEVEMLQFQVTILTETSDVRSSSR